MNLEQILEIDRLKEKMSGFAYTEAAKSKIANLIPFLSEIDVISALRETTEARTILEKHGNPPLTALDNIDEYLILASKGACLSCEQLEHIATILTTVKRLKDFLNCVKYLELGLPYYEENLNSMEHVRNEINSTIRGGKVYDYASKTLKTIRNEIEHLEQKMREKADSILKANKAYMANNYATVRNNRICLPVKKEFKLKITGSVIDKSATGSTLFIEPLAVAKYNQELEMKRFEEENEEHRILYTLTAMLSDSLDTFTRNKNTIEKLDFIFAKGKLSLDYNGTMPIVTMERKIVIKNGKHPLMDKDICVPINFEIGEDINGVIITGPNTGGKTVAIKTVGINCYMAQCGLHVSCESAQICMNNQILCDIGDGQDISENLSTFSAHIKNVLSILKKSDRESLVILDELGSGTDPAEGMGIAIAILEELKKSGALYLVTTHYPEVKNYAEKTTGVVNARMEFDRESLKPLYRLEIGKSGESCALYIAEKLGMPQNMLLTASKVAYGTEKLEFMLDNITKKIAYEHTAKLQKKKAAKNHQEQSKEFNLGDSVMIYPDRKIGIVCEPINEKGMVRIQLPNKKIWISYKRVKLQVAATQLYPENYDFSIIFDTIENRKARHQIERKYSPEVEVKTDKDNIL